MAVHKIGAALVLLLLLSGCGAPGALSPGPAAADSLSVSALFRTESGVPLEGCAAQFSAGEAGSRCPLDDRGEVTISGLPRNGELHLTLLNRQESVQGAMILSFSEGAVMDAATGEDGVGYVTVRRDTREVALTFLLSEDGALRCALRLEADHSYSQHT